MATARKFTLHSKVGGAPLDFWLIFEITKILELSEAGLTPGAFNIEEDSFLQK